jgi:hypothetical protein
VFIAFQEKLYFKLSQIDKNEYIWLTEEMMTKCNERMDRVIGNTPLHEGGSPEEASEEDLEEGSEEESCEGSSEQSCEGSEEESSKESEEESSDGSEEESSEEESSDGAISLQQSIPLSNEKHDEIESFENTFIHHSQDDKHMIIDEILGPYLQKMEKYRFTARLDLITTKCVWELKFVNEISIEHYLQFIIYAWLWKCVYNDESEGLKEFKLFNIRKEEVYILSASLEELTEIVVLIIKGKYESNIVQTDDEFVNNNNDQLL